jgi:hypothetical protein
MRLHPSPLCTHSCDLPYVLSWVQAPSFWVMARALRNFVADPAEGDGQLPLLGTLPDMESDTTSYVQLQTLYDGKSERGSK